MRSIGVWASLAFLVTVAAAHNCGQPCTCDAGTPGPKIVTYGDPCYCKESYPYTVQVPVTKSEPVENLQSYAYSLETPRVASCASSSLQLPIKIQTPIVQRQVSDQLRGRSYGVIVQRECQQQRRPNYSFDVTVQRAVQGQVEPVSKVQPLGYQVEHHQEKSASRYALPIAIQTPVRSQAPEIRLVGLTSRVDRVLVPACECNDCPDCADVQRSC